LSHGYPYTDGGHFHPRDHGYGQSSPGRADAGHPTFASLTSAQSVAEQARPTVVAFVPVATVAHHRFDETDNVHIDGAHHHPRRVMIVAIVNDETPCRGRHPE
jgi:hypothetical protein